MPQSRVMAPGSPEQALALARQHCDAGQLPAASGLCRKALRVWPDWPPALHLLGAIAIKSGDIDGGIKLVRRAISGEANNALYHYNLGTAYRQIGQLDDARREIESAIALDPHNPEYFHSISDLKRFSPDDPHLAAMERLAGHMGSLTLAAQTKLNFALAKAYSDLGRHADCFRHLLRGNTLRRAQVRYDEAEALNWFAQIRAVFDRALLDSKAGAGYPSPLPVFVVGMPRSGTTLVEQLLASHPSVHGAGEINDMEEQVARLRAGADRTIGYPACVPLLSPGQLQAFGKAYTSGLRRRAPRALRITDKTVSQVAYLGLIHLALPEARIVYVQRNPLDICFSCYSLLFDHGQHFSYDQGELGRYCRAYIELMAHWRALLPPDRFLEVRYEAVIADPETEARRLIDFCGLDWDPRCLAFHETQRPVLTASAAQVRRPIYQTSRDRSAPYRKHLGPLIAALGDLV